MRHFVYTYSERRPRGSMAMLKTVRIWRIKAKTCELERIGDFSDTYVDKFQLVMESLEMVKALPATAFERNQFGGYKYGTAWTLKEAGIAAITEIF